MENSYGNTVWEKNGGIKFSLLYAFTLFLFLEGMMGD